MQLKCGDKIKTGQNKYWDLQSINVKIVSLKPNMMMKNVFCDYTTFQYFKYILK